MVEMDEQQKAEIERQVVQIQQKIEELKRAKNRLISETTKLDFKYKDEKKKVLSDEENMEWKGEKRKSIRKYVTDEYLLEYKNYIGKINDLLGAIDLEISSLEQQCSRLKEA